MTGIQVLSFGCRLNLVESEVMRGLAASAGARKQSRPMNKP